jgi:hypothetical protein
MAVNRRPFTTTYRIVRDNDTVSKECQRFNVTFWLYKGRSSPEDEWFTLSNRKIEETSKVEDEQKNVTVEVNLFRCPITKMDLKFVRSWIPVKIFDLYITAGRNDVTVSVLRDSSIMRENICLVDMYFYTGRDSIEQKGLYMKP